MDFPRDPMAQLLIPPVTLLVKLGSIAVHADEYLNDPHKTAMSDLADRETIQSLLGDPEVSDWIEKMSEKAMLPVQRHKRN
jgi:hypothetical protein